MKEPPSRSPLEKPPGYYWRRQRSLRYLINGVQILILLGLISLAVCVVWSRM